MAPGQARNVAAPLGPEPPVHRRARPETVVRTPLRARSQFTKDIHSETSHEASKQKFNKVKENGEE